MCVYIYIYIYTSYPYPGIALPSQIDTTGILINVFLKPLLEIKEFQTQDVSSLEGSVWLEYMKRHLLGSFLSLSIFTYHRSTT